VKSIPALDLIRHVNTLMILNGPAKNGPDIMSLRKWGGSWIAQGVEGENGSKRRLCKFSDGGISPGRRIRVSDRIHPQGIPPSVRAEGRSLPLHRRPGPQALQAGVWRGLHRVRRGETNQPSVADCKEAFWLTSKLHQAVPCTGVLSPSQVAFPNNGVPDEYR